MYRTGLRPMGMHAGTDCYSGHPKLSELSCAKIEKKGNPSKLYFQVG